MNSILSGIDWPLLLFIVLAVNVKIYTKVAAIIVYLLYLILVKKVKLEKQLPGFVKFYLAMIAAGTLSSVFSGAFAISGYWFGFGWGVLQWLCAAGIGYTSFLSIRNTPATKIEKTISAFFVVNAIACIVAVISIAVHTGNFPYWYQNATGQYGVSTGDHIHGIFQSTSIVNAATCMLGALYFIGNKSLGTAMLCMFTGLLSVSNVTLCFFAIMLIALLIITKDNIVRRKALVLVFSTIAFYLILSPSNFSYLKTGIGSLMSKSTDTAGRKVRGKLQKGKIVKNYLVPIKDSISDNARQALLDLNIPSQIQGVAFDPPTAEDVLNNWYLMPLNETIVYQYRRPLKVYATRQTICFMSSDLRHLLLGSGVGNYSSKLAVKMTGLGLEGSYPGKYVYAHKDFLQHTFHTLMYVYTMDVSKHSVINWPRNVYNQIAGEYGLLGILLFIFIYIGYLFTNRQTIRLSGIILIIFTFLVLGIDYWFEYMSLTVIFEMLMMKQIEYADR